MSALIGWTFNHYEQTGYLAGLIKNADMRVLYSDKNVNKRLLHKFKTKSHFEYIKMKNS